VYNPLNGDGEPYPIPPSTGCTARTDNQWAMRHRMHLPDGEMFWGVRGEQCAVPTINGQSHMQTKTRAVAAAASTKALVKV